MFLFRWIVSLPFAILITVGLFITMAALIRDRNQPIVDPVPSIVLRITAEPRVEGDPKPDPRSKPLPKDIPVTPLEFRKSDKAPEGVLTVPARNPTPTTPPGPQKITGAIIKIPPPYPENCRSRGVEGVVVVEFDVTPEGNVSNPRVTSTPHACFNRTVIKAVSGWKYPPASGGGMRYGLVETFNFQLEE